MAKMIKCPTCGTQIEIQSAGGQVIKCPGCGKGLKLVARKPPGAARDPGASKAGSVAGGSVSAMSFHGEPPAGDDMPSLDSTCAVCGRPTDPEDLVEDNGKLICRDCIKGARSRIDRPVGGAEMLEFKQPVPAPMKRGRVINFTPAFFAACLAGLVWGGAQIYLNLVEKPRGTKVANANVAPGPDVATTVVPPLDPTTAPAPGPAPGEPIPPPAASQPTLPPLDPVAAQPPGGSTPSIPPTEPDMTPTTTQPTEIASNVGTHPPPPPPTNGSILFPPEATEPTTVEPPPAEPAIDPVSSDPLDRGVAKLHAGDYTGAVNEFDRARRQHIVGSDPNAPLTAEQSMSLNGLAAAYMGKGSYAAALGPLDAAAKRGDRSRAHVMNRAIIAMSHEPNFNKLGVAATDLKAYLDATRGDEFAANLFGTLLARAAAYPNAPKEKLQPFWDYLDNYNDAIAQGKQDLSKLKWGIEWLPAEEVKRYREARKAGGSITPTQAAQQLEKERAWLKKAQDVLAGAQKSGGDIVGAERAVEAAQLRVQEAEKTLQAAAATVAPQKWLDKIDPVVPVREVIPAPGAGAADAVRFR